MDDRVEFFCGEVLVVPSLLCVEVLELEKIGQREDAVKTLYTPMTLEDAPPCYSSPELRQLYAPPHVLAVWVSQT